MVPVGWDNPAMELHMAAAERSRVLRSLSPTMDTLALPRPEAMSYPFRAFPREAAARRHKRWRPTLAHWHRKIATSRAPKAARAAPSRGLLLVTIVAIATAVNDFMILGAQSSGNT